MTTLIALLYHLAARPVIRFVSWKVLSEFPKATQLSLLNSISPRARKRLQPTFVKRCAQRFLFCCRDRTVLSLSIYSVASHAEVSATRAKQLLSVQYDPPTKTKSRGCC